MPWQGRRSSCAVFRTSRDIVKALALGADAVAVAFAALMALGCNLYRVCHNGNCPAEIATQDPDLRRNLSVEEGTRRVANYLTVTTGELQSFGRITGHADIHDLSGEDLATTSSEISDHTDIRQV